MLRDAQKGGSKQKLWGYRTQGSENASIEGRIMRVSSQVTAGAVDAEREND